MRRVVHLIPYDGIGGVEVAARTMASGPAPGGDFAFQLRYIFADVTSRARRGATFNPLPMIAAARALAADPPDLLIVSLWRAALVGCLARLLNRRLQMVLFLHNSRDAHLLDRLATRWAVRLSVAVWTDSAASLARRLPVPPKQPVTVISYLAQRLAPLPESPPLPDAPVFAFWGRLATQKDPGRMLRFLARVRAICPGARLRLIGPDGGEEAMLRDLAAQLNLDGAVDFLGPMAFDDIRAAVTGASFYLQTSRYEGMAMSVTEAMQLGLVPVVTPVGEIGTYCRDEENALLLSHDETARTEADAAARVAALCSEPARWRALRGAAIIEWRDRPLYAASLTAAVRRLLGASDRIA